MRKISVTLVTVSLLLLKTWQPLAAEDSQPPYPFKSAIVNYKISGSIQQGTEKLYIDEHGRKTRKERNTTITILGTKKADSTIEIDDGKYHYRIDLIKKTGEKSPSYSKMAEEILKSMSPEQKEEMKEVGKEILSGLKSEGVMKPIGKGKILGKECEIYEVMGVKTYKWKNLALKIESPMLGNMAQEATELKIDCPIPPDKFKPPAGIKLSEFSPPTD